MPDIYISKDAKPTGQPLKEKSQLAHEEKEQIDTQAVENVQQEVKKHKHHKRILPADHLLPGHTHNIFTSYCYLPDHVTFQTQEKEEQVIMILRKHLITNISWLFIAVILLLAPLLLIWFPFLSFLPFRFQVFALLFWYLITAAFILEEALSWFFNVNIVTDERVIDIDFHNLIYREISGTKIDRIQDVTFRVGGAVRTIFRYGDVLIQTAGTEQKFEFSAIPSPGEVVRILRELRTEEEIEALQGRVR